MFIKMLWAVVLLALLAVSPALAQTESKAPQTKSITIGKFTYLGTAVQTDGTGGQSPVSTYILDLDASAVTVEPITFGNVIFRIKGGQLGTKNAGYPIISTGPGCTNDPRFPPCELLTTGGKGYSLPACAQSTTKGVVQNCVSVALQLVSLTGKNFTFQLLDGETFCAAGVTNVYVLAKDDQLAMDPKCDVNNFCIGASTPIVLHALPIQNCN